MSEIKEGLAQFIAAKHALEQRLRTVIAAELSAFSDLTGATVESVDVGICTMQSLCAPAERFVSSVRVVTPLD